jgi:hypothetical protein
MASQRSWSKTSRWVEGNSPSFHGDKLMHSVQAGLRAGLGGVINVTKERGGHTREPEARLLPCAVFATTPHH